MKISVFYDDREKNINKRWKLGITVGHIYREAQLWSSDFDEALAEAKKLLDRKRINWKKGTNEWNGKQYASANIKTKG